MDQQPALHPTLNAGRLGAGLVSELAWWVSWLRASGRGKQDSKQMRRGGEKHLCFRETLHVALTTEDALFLPP